MIFLLIFAFYSSQAAGYGQQSSKWAQNNAGKGYTGLGPYYEKKDAPKQEKKFKWEVIITLIKIWTIDNFSYPYYFN